MSIRSYCLLLIISLLASTSFADDTFKSSAHSALSAFVGHWEGDSDTHETKMSRANKAHSIADCRWSPQGTSLVCEQKITDSNGKHTQITIFMPNDSGSEFSFYTIASPGKRAYLGSLAIHDNVWIYGPPPDAKNDLPFFRTTNTFNGDTEVSKTEFTEDGKQWTTMLEGTLKRTAK